MQSFQSLLDARCGTDGRNLVQQVLKVAFLFPVLGRGGKVCYNKLHHDAPFHTLARHVDVFGQRRGRHEPKKAHHRCKAGRGGFVNVKADNPGPWAFHCHVLYHMDKGMLRVVRVG
jgi:Putative multicopper oxidases